MSHYTRHHRYQRHQRRARPLLGTLVEVGTDAAAPGLAIELAFSVLAEVQAALSRFEARSDVARFALLAPGGTLPLRPHTAAVLRVAQALHRDSDGLFDVTLGSGPQAWSLEGRTLHKHRAGVAFDLGGIGKGYAVDQAVEALQAAGAAAGWVNAGGDLRVFGDVELPVTLRDEVHGGVRPFLALRDGALATSRFAPGSRSPLAVMSGPARPAHVSVAAPACLWADALTKIVAASGDAHHPLLQRVGAVAWWHGSETMPHASCLAPVAA